MANERTIALRKLVAELTNVKVVTTEVSGATERNAKAINSETVAIEAQTRAVNGLITAKTKQLRLASGARSANLRGRIDPFSDLPSLSNQQFSPVGGRPAGFIPGFADPIRKNTDAMRRMAQASALAQQKFDALNPPTEKMKGFGATIIRNIGSFIGWSLAMSAVMIPIRLMSDGIKNMLEAQEELAQLSITLGREQEVLAQAYHDVADAVDGTGIAMNDALDAYAIAVRATANITDENERFAKSNELLADSLAFTKLSGMESAQAIDAISAAMRQWDIDDATQLMDIWVKTLDVANVSLEDLAEVFANSSESAKGMGLSVEELSAVVGLMAQNTTMSGAQISSALEAMFGGFTKQGGIRAFADIGKDIRDLGFLDIAQELVVLQDQMSTQDFDDLGAKLVGRRRLADLKVLLGILEDMPAALQGIEDSSNDAETALENMVQTPKSAWQDLKNEMSEFFFVLDENSGATDWITSSFRGIAGLIEDATNRLSIFSELLNQPRDMKVGILGQITTLLELWNRAGNFQTQSQAFTRTATPQSDNPLAPNYVPPIGAFSGLNGAREIEPLAEVFRGEFVGVGGMFSPEDLALIASTTQQEQERVFVEKFGTDPGADVLRESEIEDFMDIVLRGTIGEFQQLGIKADAGTVSKVISDLQEAGLISDFGDDKDSDKLNIKELPFGLSRLPSFEDTLAMVTKEVEKVTGKKVETEEIVVALKDGSLTKIEANQKIMNLVLDKIEENTKDIVRGVFNLPSGADIFVPLAAAENAAGFREEGSNFEVVFRDFISTFTASMESRFLEDVDPAGTRSAVQAINIHLTNTSFLHLDGAIIAEDTQERTTSRLNRSSGAFGGATRRVMV